VWLFSFWTWKDFFLRWFGSAASHPASGESAEHLLSEEGQQESKLAAFLSSLPKDGRRCRRLEFHGDSKVIINFEGDDLTLIHGTDGEAGFGEFLKAIASSEIVFRNVVDMALSGDNFCKYVEVFADALRKSSNIIKILAFTCYGSSVSLTKCISSVLLGNDAIQSININFFHLPKEMGKELIAEFMGNIAMPHTLQILKYVTMFLGKLDGEGMEQLMKPFQGPPSVLEELGLF